MSDDVQLAVADAVSQAFEAEQIPWFAQLVNQPSYTTAREDVEAAMAIIDAKLDQLQFRRESYADPQQTYADHRVYSAPALATDEIAIALVGHCDTVYPRSMGFLEFEREPPDSKKSDIVRGPGVLDMKSGLSVVVFALQAIQRSAPESYERLKVRFVCNTDEEVGSPSSHALFERIAPRTSAAMVFEGGREGDRIITARKGTGAFTLTVIGKAAHAGNDHATGMNAIHALALLVPRVEALTDYQAGTTTNVGTITGGSSKNTVPGEASCVIDVRVSNAEEQQRIESAFQRLAADPFADMPGVPERLQGVTVKVSGSMRRPPMEPTPESQALRQKYELFASRFGLGTGEAPRQGGGSDANGLAASGVPTIDGLGPYGKAFHSPDEWSSLDSLRRRTQTLACFLLSTAVNHAS